MIGEIVKYRDGMPYIDDGHLGQILDQTKTAFEIAKIVTQSSQLYLFAGLVRNLLTRDYSNPTDFDFIGDFDLDAIATRFPKLVVGRWDDVNTIKLRIGSSEYDFVAATDLEQQLGQCDVTISTICLGKGGEIFDPYNGIGSLFKKEIKVVDPEEKINSDPSRILRIFRFAAQLGFSIEPNTFRAAVLSAEKLDGAEYADALWDILTLPYGIRMQVLRELYRLDIDSHITFPEDLSPELAKVLALEDEIDRLAPIDAMLDLFNAKMYLVGGGVRDLLLGKKAKDFDFKIGLPLMEVIRTLKERGFVRTTNINLSDGQYYVNDRAGSVSILINDQDVDIAEMATADLTALISQGDVNFSCCIYNLETRKIENPESIGPILEKDLRFCNPDAARNDPLIVVNALKQISRLPDIKISEQTLEVIRETIPAICQLIVEHPELRYKIASLVGNLNSEEVYALFGPEYEWIFQGMERKKRKLAVTPGKYVSETLGELSDENRMLIDCLIKNAFGDHYDPSKSFPMRVNSVVYEKVGKEIVACCIVDGERIYVASATNGKGWIDIFQDLAKNNYNVWGTVDHSSPKVKALCQLAGLKVETRPEIIRKILKAKCGKQDDELKIFEKDGTTVFECVGPNNYPQVLLRS